MLSSDSSVIYIFHVTVGGKFVCIKVGVTGSSPIWNILDGINGIFSWKNFVIMRIFD
jgi:hypothetical protein